MKKSLFVLLLCVMCVGMSSCKKNHHPREDNKQKIQVAVDKIRKNLSDSLGISFPSLSLLIQTRNEKIFVSSRGESGQVVTPDTYYRFASNTKNFTSTAILNMWEDGWLDYKAKITDMIPGSKLTYVPSTADWDFPYKEKITIELLMQHAAGVFDVDNDPVRGYNGLSYTQAIQKANPRHQFTTSEMVKVLKEKNLSYFKPGEGYHYSNTGYSILAEIIKRVYTEKAGSDKTYADYMEDYLVGDYTPVPLKTIHFPVLATDIAMPDPHLISTILTPQGPQRYDNFNMTAQIGEGNGYGTMEELNKYIRTLMRGENVLKPATIKLMQKDVSTANPTYGLGCSYMKNIGYGHRGARLGFLNLMAYDPNYDVSVIVMIPLYDERNLPASFMTCFNSLSEAAYAAREVLGYPGKP
ncbi:MAG TPA: serine hydrolase domain-containing protein [Segetibacter sp.]|nr:serine hydrolase domain-containing protein [Segetibacter sp.]